MRRNGFLLLAALAALVAGCGATTSAGTTTGSGTATPISGPSGAPTTSSTSSTSTTITSTTLPPDTPARPCGWQVVHPTYSHVMWVFMENESLGQIVGAADAPFETALAHECGYATNYQAIAHPSLPNYLAATGGTTAGVTNDGEPATHPIKGSSIFAQVDAAHLTWRSYAESMPFACDRVTSGLYAARHNPAVYYVKLRARCERDDLPMGLISQGPLHAALYTSRLANFVFVTPNICDDAHSCPVEHGDSWLSNFLTTVFASPEYREGHLVVFVTFDEGSYNNNVPLIVAAPSVPQATVVGDPFSHYSLLRTTEGLLGLPPLLAAGGAKSMASAFHL